VITTIAGTGVAGASGDGNEAVEAKINNPVDVEVAADGTIYFTDTYNSCIRKIDPDGIIDTVAGHCGTGSTSRGFKGDGGPPKDALLARPYGIELDGDRLYIADSYNHRIRVVNLD
jgi:sugar lactone lactonase YvrE